MALRDDFDAIDAATVDRWIGDGQEESLNLEFKTAVSVRIDMSGTIV